MTYKTHILAGLCAELCISTQGTYDPLSVIGLSSIGIVGRLPDPEHRSARNKKQSPLGKYGRMRRQYLKEHQAENRLNKYSDKNVLL